MPALLDERGVMSFTVPGVNLDGGPMEGAPVLEPIEHSVLEKSLDGRPKEGMPVLEPLEHSVLAITLNGGPTVQITFIFIDFRVCDFAFAFKTQNAACVSRFKRVLFSDRFQFAF